MFQRTLRSQSFAYQRAIGGQVQKDVDGHRAHRN